MDVRKKTKGNRKERIDLTSQNNVLFGIANQTTVFLSRLCKTVI